MSDPILSDRLAQGRATFEASMGIPAQDFIDGFSGIAPDFGEMILRWEFADTYSRKALDLKTREIVIIAACAALGATGADSVRLHTVAALRAGATKSEIGEVLMQVGFAAGLPSAIAGLMAAKDGFDLFDAAAEAA